MNREKALLPLFLICLVGTTIRLWDLDSKPIWNDEFFTLLFSSGNSFEELPASRLIPLSDIDELLRLNRDAECTDIWRTETAEDTHPPLFFCIEHAWLSATGFSVWSLRALSAAFGVLAIVAVYLIGAACHKRSSGLIGAGLMAVSPFAVHLSQEARHYTLAMFLVSVSLFLCFLIVSKLIRRKAVAGHLWAGWTLVNIAGFFSHYFFIFSIFSQLAAMAVTVATYRTKLDLKEKLQAAFSIAALAGILLLQSGTLLEQTSGAQTDWLMLDLSNPLDWLSPPFFTLVNLVPTTAGIPIVMGSFVATLVLTAFSALVVAWIIWQAVRGQERILQSPFGPGFLFLALYTYAVLFSFIGGSYVFGKNIPYVPRYNVIYFPAVCALLGFALRMLPATEPNASSLLCRLWNPKRAEAIAAVAIIFTTLSLLLVSGVTHKKWLIGEQALDYMATHHSPLVVAGDAGRIMSYAATLALQRRITNDDLYFFIAEDGSILEHLGKTRLDPSQAVELITIKSPFSEELDKACEAVPSHLDDRAIKIHRCHLI